MILQKTSTIVAKVTKYITTIPQISLTYGFCEKCECYIRRYRTIKLIRCLDLYQYNKERKC